MTLSKKTNALSTAITVAMLAGGMMASTSALALPEAPPAPGPYVSKNDMGQALIFPYYTVNGGFKTNFSIFNTSSTHAIAVKINIREYDNSRDVKNFVVVLSPNDKWAANIVATDRTDGPDVLNMRDGIAELRTSDTSCTVPAIMDEDGNGALFDATSYTGSMDRMKQGYITAVPMGMADAGTRLFRAALHAQPDGVPGNCEAIRNAFAPQENYRVGTAPGDGSPSIMTAGWEPLGDGNNPLFGELVLLNEDGVDGDPSNNGGVAGGTNAVAIADWMGPSTLFAAQAYPWNNEPTISSSEGLWTNDGLTAVETALSSAKVVNEWAYNENNGALAEWVVTFPTKGYHVDGSATSTDLYAAMNMYRTGTHTTLPAFTQTGDGSVELEVEEFDREEGTTDPYGDISFSPGSLDPLPKLQYEANTINFSGETGPGTGMVNRSVLNSANPLILDPKGDINNGAGPVENNGYATIGFYSDAVEADASGSLPVVGFVFKQRDLGDSAKAYGQIMDHKYVNTVAPTPE